MKLEEAHRMLDSIAARRAEEWALIKTLGLADRLPDPATSVNPTDAQQPRPIPCAAYTCFALPEGLHPNTATLVRDFAEAMAKKLRASEVKYGWKAGWMRKGWRDELAAELLRHVHKGDPIDVAAYAAFAWFHGWSVTPAEASAASGGQVATIIPYTDEDGKPDMDDWRMIAIGRPGDVPDHVLDRIPTKAAGIICEMINRSAPQPTGTPTPEFGYTNWRGEFARRRVQPLQLCYGSTEWHPEPQWLLKATDLDKGEVRVFAFKDIAPAYDPLRRIDYPEGRFGPAMLDGDDEMTGKELKLIAKSHSFELRLKVEEWEGEAGEIMERGGTFAEALEATCLLQVDKDGYRLVGAWDSEDGDLVLAYVRPLVADAKSEGSANG